MPLIATGELPSSKQIKIVSVILMNMNRCWVMVDRKLDFSLFMQKLIFLPVVSAAENSCGRNMFLVVGHIPVLRTPFAAVWEVSGFT